MEYTQLNGFIVLQNLVHGAVQPVFSNDDGLMFFPDENSAQLEVMDAIESVSDAIQQGNMNEGSRETADDYEIVPATIINPWKEPTQQTIICFLEGLCYGMLRGEDDWMRLNLQSVNSRYTYPHGTTLP